MGKLYVVGDVHGDVQALDKVVTTIKKDYSQKNKDLVIFVGDYIDRGRDSLGVINYLRNLNLNVRYLMGNHDYEFLNNLTYFSNLKIEDYLWWNLPGFLTFEARIGFMMVYQYEALQSFVEGLEKKGEYLELLDYFKMNLHRINSRDLDFKELSARLEQFRLMCQDIEVNYLPQLNFLSNLEYAIETDKYIISHSGGDKNKPLINNTEEDWVWSRDYTTGKYTKDKEYIVGHTPTQSGEVEVDVENKHIFVDTGAIFYGVDIGLYITDYTYATRIK